MYPDPSFGSAAETEALRAAAAADPIGFWVDRAAELDWFEPWDTVLDDSNAPFYK